MNAAIINGNVWHLDPFNYFTNSSPQNTLDHCGMIPGFFDSKCEKSADEQLKTGYGFPLHNIPQTEFLAGLLLSEGDPDLYPLAVAVMPGCLVSIYEYGLVSIAYKGGEGNTVYRAD